MCIRDSGTDTNTSSGYSAEITIDNTELLVGMSAKAKIVIKDRGTQLAVPYDPVSYTHLETIIKKCVIKSLFMTLTVRNVMEGDFCF